MTARRGIEVLATGPLTTVQDLGRPGLAGLGVGRSGAADRPGLSLANRLVGNPEGAAGLELTLGGLAVRFTGPAIVALAGAACPLRLDGRAVDMYGPVCAGAGQRLDVGTPPTGLRTYLAVRGGIDVPPVLGARATDVLSGLGPDPLEPGRTLPIGTDAIGQPATDHAPQPPAAGRRVLRLHPGPRADWFAAGELRTLCAAPYEVTAHSNRVGLRLHGPPLRRRVHGELPSEPMVCGAVQVPPDGHPVLFLADHPVTGGYPVIAVVATADIHRAAQARPGDRLTFRLA